MNVVITEELNSGRRGDPVKLRKARRRAGDGKIETVYRVDVGGADFAEQFTEAFRLSVRRARDEHRKNGLGA